MSNRRVAPGADHWWALPVRVAMVCTLAGCGGGGGGGSSASTSAVLAAGPAASPVATAVADPGSAADDSQTLAQHCSPANSLAHDPVYLQSAPGVTYTSFNDEKKWLLRYMQESYLWPGEMPTVDASLAPFSDPTDLTGSIARYLAALKTPRMTPSGEPVDRFSAVVPTAASSAYFDSGVLTGSGIDWAVVSDEVPRRIRVAAVHTASAAAGLDVARGDTVVSVDGVSVDTASTADLDRLSTALFAPVAKTSYRYILARADGSRQVIDLSTGSYAENAVPLATTLVQGGRRIGYLLFNDHTASAESALFDAVLGFQRDAIADLAVDLRYNGGGYLDVAAQLAAMLAPARQRDQVFERLAYNAAHASRNQSIPLGSQLCVPQGASGACSRSDPLPSLELDTVYVITSGLTCSASESLVNGLRGVGVNVVTIGGTTCGKPYGYTGRDNCGLSYFVVEFAGVNARGEGGYVDGLPASCAGSDDLDHPLGDPNETLLHTALQRAVTGACPAVSAVAPATGPSVRALSTTTGETLISGAVLRRPARLLGPVLRSKAGER